MFAVCVLLQCIAGGMMNHEHDHSRICQHVQCMQRALLSSVTVVWEYIPLSPQGGNTLSNMLAPSLCLFPSACLAQLQPLAGVSLMSSCY